jgi:hypothetical protein
VHVCTLKIATFAHFSDLSPPVPPQLVLDRRWSQMPQWFEMIFLFRCPSRNGGHNLRRPSFKFHVETRLRRVPTYLARALSELAHVSISLARVLTYLAYVPTLLAHVPTCLARVHIYLVRVQPTSCIFSSAYFPQYLCRELSLPPFLESWPFGTLQLTWQ